MSTNITATKQALLELTQEIESIKEQLTIASRERDMSAVFSLQRRMAECMDLITACMTQIHEALEETILTSKLTN